MAAPSSTAFRPAVHRGLSGRAFLTPRTRA